MTDIYDVVKSLLTNDDKILTAAMETLLKIADNILKNPEQEKFRQLSLCSNVMDQKLLPAVGALEILFLMGFEEGDNKLIFPSYASLDVLRQYRDQIQALGKKINDGEIEHPTKTAVAPQITPAIMASESQFRGSLSSQFEQVMIYESSGLQEKARQAVPVKELSQLARESLSTINDNISDQDRPLNFQDCLLLQLLRWFKSSFFKWFDTGKCDACNTKMEYCGQVVPSEDDLKWGARRVEGYRCKVCNCEKRFPRYNHPGKLLETKEGRCGEWANCFTLICRSLGMDARYIHDDTDHVWSEVYSLSQSRWLHADCCEAKLDTPLMYESGWGKKLSYIIAYSKDEVVDVTWRYSTQHKQVCNRRKKCREEWLVSTLAELNTERQSNFNEPKRNFLLQRLVAEVSEFFKSTTNRQVKKGETEGRSSGSLAWRLSRKEVGSDDTDDNVDKEFMFKIKPEEIESKEMIIKYSAVLDAYRRPLTNEELSGWRSGVFSSKGVFRKHETDWNMVYLARDEGTDTGKVSWHMDWTDCNLIVKSILVILQHNTFEGASVNWQVCIGGACIPGSANGIVDISKDLLTRETRHVEITVELTGGSGNSSWQHSQLFRMADSDKEKFPFLVDIKFESNES